MLKTISSIKVLDKMHTTFECSLSAPILVFILLRYHINDDDIITMILVSSQIPYCLD